MSFVWSCSLESSTPPFFWGEWWVWGWSYHLLLPTTFALSSLTFSFDHKSCVSWMFSVKLPVLHFHSFLLVFSFVSGSRLSVHYLASAHTPMWWLSGLERRVHKFSPSSDSFARPSFMACTCKHFRVVVESLKETVGIHKRKSASNQKLWKPKSTLPAPHSALTTLDLWMLCKRKTGSCALILYSWNQRRCSDDVS